MIEIMVALGILGLGLFVLLQGHFATIRMCNRIDDKVTERQLFQRAMAQAEIDVVAGESSGSGDFGERYSDYSFSWEATPFNGENAPGLYVVEVRLQGRDQTETMSMVVCDVGQTW